MTERDFSRDLTIMVAGTGAVDKRNLRAELDDWVFGNADSREVRIIFPILNRPAPGMRAMVDWAIDVEADVQVVQTLGAGMTKELAALDDIIRVEHERDALDKSFELLLEREKAGDETVFVMFYNPESTYKQGDPNLSDYETLAEAKNHTWLTTLNAEAMVDAFEGFETTDEMILREKAEREFAEQEAEKAAEEKAAKKAVAPRKRAAAKKVAPKATDSVEAAEKPLQDSSTPGLDKLVADAVAKDKAQPKEVHEIVGKVETLDEMLGAERPAALELKAETKLAPQLKTVEAADVWSDVAKAYPNVARRQDELVAQLGEDIANMGDAFSRTIRTYAALIEEIRNA